MILNMAMVLGTQKIEDMNDNAKLDHTLIHSNQPIAFCHWEDEDNTLDCNASSLLSRSKTHVKRSKSVDVINHDVETKISTISQQSKKRKTQQYTRR